eukprot:3141685-Prymnesium_polylepis.1
MDMLRLWLCAKTHAIERGNPASVQRAKSDDHSPALFVRPKRVEPEKEPCAPAGVQSSPLRLRRTRCVGKADLQLAVPPNPRVPVSMRLAPCVPQPGSD